MLSVQELRDEINKVETLNFKELRGQMKRYGERNIPNCYELYCVTIDKFEDAIHINYKPFYNLTFIIRVFKFSQIKLHITATDLQDNNYRFSSEYDSVYQKEIDNYKFDNVKLEMINYFLTNYKLIGETFIKKYNLLYKTKYYYNLQSTTTFLLICKSKPIFPKDIYLLIAKKILFFVFFFSTKKLKKGNLKKKLIRMRLCVKDIDEMRKNTHDAIILELYKICKRYLESENLKIGKDSKISYKQTYFDVELIVEDFRVYLGFGQDITSYCVSISLLDAYTYLYKRSSRYGDGYITKNIDEFSNLRKVYDYFKLPTDFIKYINHIYDKLFNTNYYYDLQSVTTFILICKSRPIFPKDIYLLIAKKILFFSFPQKLKGLIS